MNDRVVGSGDLKFELVDGWQHVPEGWHQFDVPAVCTDQAGNVYTFWRGDHRVVVYDRSGRCVDSWSEAPFDVRAHGIYMSPALQLLGPSGVPSDRGYDGENYRTVTHGSSPYRRPTSAAVALGESSTPTTPVTVSRASAARTGNGACCATRRSRPPTTTTASTAA